MWSKQGTTVYNDQTFLPTTSATYGLLHCVCERAHFYNPTITFKENTDFGRAVREALGLDEEGGTEGRGETTGGEEEEEEEEGGDDDNANINSGNTKTPATATAATTTTRDAALRDVDLRTMPGRDFTYQAGTGRALDIR